MVHPLQWVLAFEIFIPLVLFFILLGLRQKKPTISVKEGKAAAWPGCSGWQGGSGALTALSMRAQTHVPHSVAPQAWSCHIP